MPSGRRVARRFKVLIEAEYGVQQYVVLVVIVRSIYITLYNLNVRDAFQSFGQKNLHSRVSPIF